ncbi:Acetate kinase [Methanimicrococcus hongohii]|uniref:Acetate kinase n=1 Tax=Methanimicrococcus hongohii TaxID=3028295 RepID=A0AA96V1L3_9EURY|nr:acetate kinase [Methanimicrococcus sp. Hf6]WNY24223.1 Acetate kinase [Methanimicrococcus sp. Hf6]
MDVLVLNCGSSSLKYQLINMDTETVLVKGLCERIGIDGFLKHDRGDFVYEINHPMPDHEAAVKIVIEALLDPDHGVIKSMDEITAVGHRVVHGGEHFTDSVLINDEVERIIEKCSELAPLHNPANLTGIRACKHIMPNVPQVAVFDTAFHASMPAKAYLYAIPYEFYEKHKLRKYGFHGTSHKYVSMRAAEMLGKSYDQLKIITCHLGNGASVCAIDGGHSIDTSMGLTPLEGLIMGTRSGDIDPAVVTFIMEKENLTAHETINLLNKKSGVLGISGVSSDFRDLDEAMGEGNELAKAALNAYWYRIARYIGSYAAAMNGADAIVFTAGVGENHIETREEVCKYLTYLGVDVDSEKNNVRGKEVDFSKDGAKVRTLLIPTNEELVIARDTKHAIM